MINNQIIAQGITFNYLEVDVMSNQDIIYRNTNLRIEIKIRIYKTCIRSILTYATETKADTIKTKQVLRRLEMEVIKPILEKTRSNKKCRQQAVFKRM